MLTIPGYEVGEAIFEGEGFRVHRARSSDGRPVLLKVLTTGEPSAEEIVARSREHELEELLRTTQSQLVQSEKMASLGRLTMGVAHEIKNPLNFVNNFAKLSVELCEEIEQTVIQTPDALVGDVIDVIGDLKLNSTKICEHGTRADEIVRSMLRHTGGGAGERRTVELNALVDDFVRLASLGVRARQGKIDVRIETDYDKAAGQVTVVPQDIGRVVVNLIDNAIDAVMARSKAVGAPFKPTVRVSTRRAGSTFEIRIADNGTGIPEGIRARVFEPFFTTKPPGMGTGLGLSLSYDVIVSGHGGKLAFESAVGDGTTFVITVPA